MFCSFSADSKVLKTTNLDDLSPLPQRKELSSSANANANKAQLYELLKFSPETASPETDDAISQTSNEHNVSDCPTIPVHEGSSQTGSYMNPSSHSDFSSHGLSPQSMFQSCYGKSFIRRYFLFKKERFTAYSKDHYISMMDVLSDVSYFFWLFLICCLTQQKTAKTVVIVALSTVPVVILSECFRKRSRGNTVTYGSESSQLDTLFLLFLLCIVKHEMTIVNCDLLVRGWKGAVKACLCNQERHCPKYGLSCNALLKSFTERSIKTAERWKAPWGENKGFMRGTKTVQGSNQANSPQIINHLRFLMNVQRCEWNIIEKIWLLLSSVNQSTSASIWKRHKFLRSDSFSGLLYRKQETNWVQWPHKKKIITKMLCIEFGDNCTVVKIYACRSSGRHFDLGQKRWSKCLLCWRKTVSNVSLKMHVCHTLVQSRAISQPV